jgi:hypothetical protein
MSLQKVLWAATAALAFAGTAFADPVRTIFTRENRLPEAMGGEVYLGGGASSYDGDWGEEDLDDYFFSLGGRFGLTDRFAVGLSIPYVGYSLGDFEEKGLGDMQASADFLLFEDIFDYAWILPHANVLIPTGDEEKALGRGDTLVKLGVSIGTTTMDVLHWVGDVSFTPEGAADEDDLLTGSVSLVWDLDPQASLIGEVEFSDDTVDEDDNYSLRYHLGMAYRINEHFTAMAYGGSASRTSLDFYGMGRIVYQF